MATKKIDGKLFISRGITETNKRDAQHMARGFRKNGDLARVVRHGDGWTAFVRPKMRR